MICRFVAFRIRGRLHLQVLYIMSGKLFIHISYFSRSVIVNWGAVRHRADHRLTVRLCSHLLATIVSNKILR
jgi:hypothetical protein